ncbi:MAG: CoB--CoM heterodisulfide reductase iron-sulfur subunit A family protein, partial [Anaerolineae bacterium]|nr:CoB--CoM heterodisulfide reductase iron-sulfur subunit A family protein [Anaerolineae bacterium]
DRRAMVIGGGISGIQAALDIANSGYEVVLVERLPSIGGHMAQLSETFPTLDCSQCILTPRTVEMGHHEKIKLATYSKVEEVTGQGGDFRVKVRRKPAYVDWERCTGCGLCQEKCPWRVPSDFERGMGKRKVIYTLSPQAVPNKPVIDREHCVYFQKGGKCGVCVKFCPVEAIDFQQKEEIWEEQVGAIVVATGYDLYPMERLVEYGGGRYPDVIDSLQFERLLSASGPTGGEIRRPSDGRVPQEVVFVQCAGSRDPERGVAYCSQICCMYTAKQALLYKHKIPDGQAYVFYIDIRAGGKGYEEFVQRAMEEGVLYLRGKVSKIFSQNDKVMVWGADTLSGKRVEIAADLVVLATAILPSQETSELKEKLGIKIDESGFYEEAHPQVRPVESGVPGIYLAGAGQGPKDIPEAVALGSAAAAKVLAIFAPEVSP